MKTLNEYLEMIRRSESETSQKRELKSIIEEVIDEILTRDYLIYTDEGDAVYDYEEFESFKSEIK